MPRFSYLLPLAALALLGAGCAGPEETATVFEPIAARSGQTVYDERADFGFALQVPQGWEKDESKETDNLTTAFYTPFTDENDTYKENVVVTAITIPEGESVTARDFADASHTGLEKSVADLALTDLGEEPLGGRNALTFVFSGTIENEDGDRAPVKGMEHFILTDDVAYMFAFAAADAQYDDFKPAADAVFATVVLP